MSRESRRPRLRTISPPTSEGLAKISARGIAIDAAQKLYVAGATTSTDFPLSGNAYDSSGDGSTDAFVARLDLSVVDANKVTYSTYLGAAGEDAAAGVAADNANNVFVTGSTNGQGFPVTVGGAVTGEDQTFVAKLILTTAPAAPVVTISAATPDVVLTWGGASGATGYEIYRSGAPYFNPGDPGSTLLPGPATSPYHDPGALTAPASYFYVVRSVGAPGVTSASSNRGGQVHLPSRERQLSRSPPRL